MVFNPSIEQLRIASTLSFWWRHKLSLCRTRRLQLQHGALTESLTGRPVLTLLLFASHS